MLLNQHFLKSIREFLSYVLNIYFIVLLKHSGTICDILVQSILKNFTSAAQAIPMVQLGLIVQFKC